MAKTCSKGFKRSMSFKGCFCNVLNLLNLLNLLNNSLNLLNNLEILK